MAQLQHDSHTPIRPGHPCGLRWIENKPGYDRIAMDPDTALASVLGLDITIVPGGKQVEGVSHKQSDTGS